MKSVLYIKIDTVTLHIHEFKCAHKFTIEAVMFYKTQTL